MNEKLSKIILELLDIQSSGKASVFISFSGHVNHIEVRIYLPAWKANADADFITTAYLDNQDDFDKFEEEMNRFIKLFKLLSK